MSLNHWFVSSYSGRPSDTYTSIGWRATQTHQSNASNELACPQTLFTYPDNWRAFKAQIAAQYSGARLKVASTAPAFSFGQTNRAPAFLNNFPLGKVGEVNIQSN